MSDDAPATGRGLLIVLLVGVLVAPGVLSIWESFQAEGKAPHFTLIDTGYRDGALGEPQEFSLSDFEGKTVVIDFMAFNCGACRWTTPNLIHPLWERFHENEDFVMLSIDAGNFANFPGSTEENLLKWQTGDVHNLPEGPWRHALDRDGIFREYQGVGAFGLPAIFVVDGERDIVQVLNGRGDLDSLSSVVEASLAGNAESAQVLQVGVIGLALVAGLASFFAPCSVGLIPAYMGFLLNRDQGAHPTRHRRLHAIWPGFETAAGIVAIYAVLAVIIWLAGGLLEPVFPYMGFVVGSLLVLFGLLMLVGFDWERVAKVFGMGKVDGRKGFFVFGVGYGLAAFGCTGPIFLPILLAGFSEGPALGFLAFAVYSVAVASFVVFAAYLVSAGKQTSLRALLAHTKTITRISAVLLIGAGAYLLWFDYQVFGL